MSGLSGIYTLENSCDEKFTLNFSTYNDKFASDNLHQENDKLIIAIEGCILNIDKLKAEHKQNDLFLLINTLWEKHKENITQQMRGSFTLVVFDKSSNRLFVTNDLLSKKPLYFYQSEKLFMFSSKYHDLMSMAKSHNIKLTLNNLAVAMMLTKDYLGDSVTYAKEISYLKAYHYLVVAGDKFTEYKYDVNSTLLTMSEDEIIKKLDELFSHAVEEQFQKNSAASYKQLSTLSAGMDSRVCLLYAHKMGFKDGLCLSYAQSGSIDYSVSRKIAHDYHYEYIFYPLDAATFLYTPDVLSEKNECQQSYTGATGAYQSIKIIDTTEYGIIHTGLLGGELLSEVFTKLRFTEVNLRNSAMEKLPLWNESLANEYKEIKNKYKSEEEYLLFEHLRACQNFIRMVDYKCEAFSPFMHEDFFEFVNRIPPELRIHRKIYRKWMSKYVPNDYVSTYTKTNINAGPIKEFLSKVYNVFVKVTLGKSKFCMNPIEYWGKTIPNLSTELNRIYQTELESLVDIDDVVKDSVKQVKSNGTWGAVQAITALKAINRVVSTYEKTV